MDILIIILVCVTGGFINTEVPNNWKYIFGFTVASLLNLILNIIKINS